VGERGGMRRGKFTNINDEKAITDIINMWEMDKTGAAEDGLP
jgi:hypothetical protein